MNIIVSADTPSFDDLTVTFMRRYGAAYISSTNPQLRPSDRKIAASIAEGMAQILAPMLGFATTDAFNGLAFNVLNTMNYNGDPVSFGRVPKSPGRFRWYKHHDAAYATRFAEAFLLVHHQAVASRAEADRVFLNNISKIHAQNTSVRILPSVLRETKVASEDEIDDVSEMLDDDVIVRPPRAASFDPDVVVLDEV